MESKTTDAVPSTAGRMADERPSAEPAAVQSVARVFDILEAVEAAGGTAGITEIRESTRLAVATIHRLSRTLVGRGYLRQLPDRRYSLGARLVGLGTRANSLIGERARPVLVALAARLGESANLAVRVGERAEYVGQAPGPHTMRTFTEVGGRVPLHCTGVGKALLSVLDERTVRRLLATGGMPAQTSSTITDVEDMLAELVSIRSRGYAIDEGEQEWGVRCIAVPVHAATSPMALSISGPALRMTDELIERAEPALNAAAAQLALVLSS